MASSAGASNSEAKLRGIVSLAADAIISTDGAYRITLFNPAAERIFGYSAGEVLGRRGPLDRAVEDLRADDAVEPEEPLLARTVVPGVEVEVALGGRDRHRVDDP